MEGALDDARHELRRDEVREFWHKNGQHSGTVHLFVGRPAARGVEFLQVGVRAVSIVTFPWAPRAVTRREKRAAAKQDRPEAVVPATDCLRHQCFSNKVWGVRVCARLEESVCNGGTLPTICEHHHKQRRTGLAASMPRRVGVTAGG